MKRGLKRIVFAVMCISLFCGGLYSYPSVIQAKTEYHFNLDGTIAYFTKGEKYYAASGKRLNDIQKKNVITREHARTIIKKCTKKGMTEKEKLLACFKWIVKNYYYTEYSCDGKKGWTSEAGDAMLVKNNGDCRTLAAGFAFLASELGYEDVYICQDSKNKFSGSHCWTQVDGKCYDPLFYNSRRPKRYMDVFCGSSTKAYYNKTHCTANQKFAPGE